MFYYVSLVYLFYYNFFFLLVNNIHPFKFFFFVFNWYNKNQFIDKIPQINFGYVCVLLCINVVTYTSVEVYLLRKI